MPAFLSDPAPALYLILLAAVVITGAIAARNQNRRSFLWFGIAAAALLAVYGIDRAIESPREEAVRRVEAMARAADAKNPDQFMEHLADTIEFRGSAQPVTVKKAAIRTSPFWAMLRQYQVAVNVWDFSREYVKQSDDNTMEVGFAANGSAEGKQFPIFMTATFKKQADGQWKLTAFASYEFAKHDSLLAIPNFP